MSRSTPSGVRLSLRSAVLGSSTSVPNNRSAASIRSSSNDSAACRTRIAVAAVS